MKPMVLVAVTIVIMFIVAYTLRQGSHRVCNGHQQPLLKDSSACAGFDFQTSGSGLLTWHPFY